MSMTAESSERDANGTTSPRTDLSPGSIRAALDKILASPGFINADRLTRFLRYTVEETLNGQTDKLKETLLGIEVFNRKTTYDPRVDAVVRTEAVKLRARLRDYYEADGREDELIIDLPKGGYVPAFRIREKPVETPAAAAVEGFDNTHKGHDWRPAIAGALIVAILAISIYLTTRNRTRAATNPAGADVASIAVLPFADLSPDRDQEYFCDGMTEEIIDALAKVEGFRVVARTSSFAFKGKQQDIREIGKKLNVGAVLEGSVRKDGNLLRVTAQLNSVADGYHLWSQTYERELKDVFAVQDEIAKAIVSTLQLKLASPQPKRARNVEVYDLYLQGRYHWGRWRTEGAERALQFFEQATQKDPAYAGAYAGIADSYAWLGFFGTLPPNEAMPKARAAAENRRPLWLQHCLFVAARPQRGSIARDATGSRSGPTLACDQYLSGPGLFLQRSAGPGFGVRQEGAGLGPEFRRSPAGPGDESVGRQDLDRFLCGCCRGQRPRSGKQDRSVARLRRCDTRQEGGCA
jgi:TolB-like protein